MRSVNAYKVRKDLGRGGALETVFLFLPSEEDIVKAFSQSEPLPDKIQFEILNHDFQIHKVVVFVRDSSNEN